MCICNHMYQFPDFHITHLCQHMKKHCILTYIPVIRSEYIIGSLIEHSIQRKLLMSFFFRNIKCHTVRTRVQVHLMKILMYINIRHDPSAVRIILQIIDHTVYLIEHSLLVLMFYGHLVSIGFSNRSIFICPAVPDMTVQIMNVVRFLLPYP